MRREPLRFLAITRIYANPQRVSLLSLLGMNAKYDRCRGVELFTLDGRCNRDFLSGYCVHNAGHNHPYIIRALKDEMGMGLLNGIQFVSPRSLVIRALYEAFHSIHPAIFG